MGEIRAHISAAPPGRSHHACHAPHAQRSAPLDHSFDGEPEDDATDDLDDEGVSGFVHVRVQMGVEG